jgi:hypothetical protein
VIVLIGFPPSSSLPVIINSLGAEKETMKKEMKQSNFLCMPLTGLDVVTTSHIQ